jgi:hypothetical protein
MLIKMDTMRVEVKRCVCMGLPPFSEETKIPEKSTSTTTSGFSFSERRGKSIDAEALRQMACPPPPFLLTPP